MFYKTGLLSRGLTIERGLNFQDLRYLKGWQGWQQLTVNLTVKLDFYHIDACPLNFEMPFSCYVILGVQDQRKIWKTKIFLHQSKLEFLIWNNLWIWFSMTLFATINKIMSILLIPRCLVSLKSQLFQWNAINHPLYRLFNELFGTLAYWLGFCDVTAPRKFHETNYFALGNRGTSLKIQSHRRARRPGK